MLKPIDIRVSVVSVTALITHSVARRPWRVGVAYRAPFGRSRESYYTITCNY